MNEELLKDYLKLQEEISNGGMNGFEGYPAETIIKELNNQWKRKSEIVDAFESFDGTTFEEFKEHYKNF